MVYKYKEISIDSFLESLYKDGLNESNILTHDEIINLISDIGVFRLKGYIKAFRDNLNNYSIDDLFNLYEIDRKISLNMFNLVSKIEIKLKANLIEVAYGLTDNPFFYLLKESYIEDFTIDEKSLESWKIKNEDSIRKREIYLHYRDYYLQKYSFSKNLEKYLKDKELIKIKDYVNYPPFHYFIEDLTLGSLINILSKLKIDEQKILQVVSKRFNINNSKVFLKYLLRVKEVRNRCAHNDRLFNRNYRGVKAFGKHKEYRKVVFEYKLIDVYCSLNFLIYGEHKFNTTNELIDEFIEKILLCGDEKIKDWILRIVKKSDKVSVQAEAYRR